VSIPPNSELVAVAWLRGVPGLSPDIVATSRPRDSDTWADNGFVQVGDAGGNPDRDIPMRRPVMSLHLWANNPQSGKPPWGKAAALGEYILADCQRHQHRNVTAHLPAGYSGARVMSAYALSEVRRVPGDLTSFAHYQLDLQLHWCVVP